MSSLLAWQLRLASVSASSIQEPAAGTAPKPRIDSPPTSQPPAADDELPVEQARLADRFKRLEEVLGRLAEFSASTDPRRAKLLRDAIAQSREQDINVRFESIVKLLEDERLSAAATNQTELQKELDSLLTLLLKADRDKELSSQRDRVKKYLKEVGRLIRDAKRRSCPHRRRRRTQAARQRSTAHRRRHRQARRRHLQNRRRQEDRKATKTRSRRKQGR